MVAPSEVPIPPARVPRPAPGLSSGATVGASGLQHVIGHGRQQAVIAEVGATLRSYTVGERMVIDGFGLDDLAPNGRGQVLAPWPNRLGDGRYRFEGRLATAALDEPERQNAIHGLVRWMAWTVEASAQNVVTLGCVLHPQPGYPWRLALSVEYRLGRDGLVVTSRASNPGSDPIPFGIGSHPYVRVGGAGVDEMRLRLTAARRLVNDERGLPVGEAAVAGTDFDFTAGRRIGSSVLDTAYTGLLRDKGGRAIVDVDPSDGGAGVTVWLDESYPYVTVFSADTVDPPSRRRQSLAIEPMTCPADALRSGTSLVVLEPGGSWSGTWGITPR